MSEHVFLVLVCVCVGARASALICLGCVGASAAAAVLRASFRVFALFDLSPDRVLHLVVQMYLAHRDLFVPESLAVHEKSHFGWRSPVWQDLAGRAALPPPRGDMAAGGGAQQGSGTQQQPSGGGGNSVQKVVGPNVMGSREEYQLVRRLQSALFGGVYEAKGLSSGRDFAIKVLHKSELTKAQETNSIEFCEVPLSEIRFAEHMRGHENVMEPEEHFEDQYCFYVVFDLCRGGDLLEALKPKQRGFDELQAQALIKQATKGLAYLHQRRVAMQDVSLENMLLHVEETTGHYCVKVCDPGQAAIFDLDSAGEEKEVGFRGLVGKSFRPPELHKQKPYLATKVDSWCLGWSTFYLLTAQPLFMSADPAQQDSDWTLFEQGHYMALFSQKSKVCSYTALDFIFRLMQLEPSRRMSVVDALDHAWLTDAKICPVLAPQEFWPESLQKSRRSLGASLGATITPPGAAVPAEDSMVSQSAPQHQASLDDDSTKAVPPPPPPNSIVPTLATSTPGSTSLPVASAKPPNGSISWGAPAAGELPAWSAAPGQLMSTPVLRVQSPARSPRATAAHGALQFDQRRSRGRQVQMQGGAARLPYVVATNHSPAPVGLSPVSPTHRVLSSASIRAASPPQSHHPALQLRAQPVTAVPTGVPEAAQGFQQHSAFTTPRMASRPRSPSGGVEVSPIRMDGKQPAWAFKADAEENHGVGMSTMPDGCRPRGSRPTAVRALSPQTTMSQQVVHVGGTAQVRYVQSPTRAQAPVYMQARSPSPVHIQGMLSVVRPSPSQMRSASPGAPRGGISWTQVAPTFSPRHGGSPAMSRAASPLGQTAIPAAGAPAGPVGFSFTPDLPSPRFENRTMSPAPSGAITFPKRVPAPSAMRQPVVLRR